MQLQKLDININEQQNALKSLSSEKYTPTSQ